MPALASGRRVVVATATKALQEQLLTKDVPARGRGARPGACRWPCSRGARTTCAGTRCTGSACSAARCSHGRRTPPTSSGCGPWFDETETGDRAELAFEPSDTLWSELAVGADRCLGRTCAFVGTCFSEAARRSARAADLVIVNHALYFADLGLREEPDASILPEHDAVVFDEAHRLEETAATWLGGGVSTDGLRRLERDVERACREAGVPVPVRALDRVRRAEAR